MIKIAIISHKGGVAKTTSAQNLGAGLALFGKKRVLIMDLDPQGNLSRCFGINHRDQKLTSGSFILRDEPLSEVAINVKIKYKHDAKSEPVESEVKITPSNRLLEAQQEMLKIRGSYPFNLQEALEDYEKDFDYCLFDCPPSLQGMSKIALAACNFFIIPLQAQFLSYEGLADTLIYAKEIAKINPSVNFGGVFATKYNPGVNRNMSKELVNAAKNQIGEKLLNTYIRECINLDEAQRQGLCIFEYMPKSKGSQDYYELTKEILQITAA